MSSSVVKRGETLRVAIFLAALLVASGCADVENDAEIAEDTYRYSLPTQEFQHVELNHTEEGELIFELTAPHLDRYDRRDEAAIYGGIEVRFFDEGVLSSTLTSDSGVVLRGGKELRAIGRVVVSTDTTTILTPRLTWTRDDGMVRSDTVVTIITEYDTLRGTGLIATDDLKKRRVLNPSGISMRSEGRSAAGMNPFQLSGPDSDSLETDTLETDSLSTGGGIMLTPPDGSAVDEDTLGKSAVAPEPMGSRIPASGEAAHLNVQDSLMERSDSLSDLETIGGETGASMPADTLASDTSASGENGQ